MLQMSRTACVCVYVCVCVCIVYGCVRELMSSEQRRDFFPAKKQSTYTYDLIHCLIFTTSHSTLPLLHPILLQVFFPEKKRGTYTHDLIHCFIAVECECSKCHVLHIYIYIYICIVRTRQSDGDQERRHYP